MADDPSKLRPADPDEFRHTLEFALTFNGRKRFQHADSLMARITADHLAAHLERCGYVLMQRPPGPGHSTPGSAGRSRLGDRKNQALDSDGSG